MSAVIHELPCRPTVRTSLSRTLTGRHLPSDGSGGVIARMEGVSATRAYVRAIARKHPLSDAVGSVDVWAQVADILSLVPNLPGCVRELDDLAHALRATLSGHRPGRMKRETVQLRSCRVCVTATAHAARIAMSGRDGLRVVTLLLAPDRARRVDDRTYAA